QAGVAFTAEPDEQVGVARKIGVRVMVISDDAEQQPGGPAAAAWGPLPHMRNAGRANVLVAEHLQPAVLIRGYGDVGIRSVAHLEPDGIRHDYSFLFRYGITIDR